jgi:L-alanine-DL-glutamate epimerase-like enolase superfamily enzyme
VRKPSRDAVRAIRHAISPRLAIRTDENMAAHYSTAAAACQATLERFPFLRIGNAL